MKTFHVLATRLLISLGVALLAVGLFVAPDQAVFATDGCDICCSATYGAPPNPNYSLCMTECQGGFGVCGAPASCNPGDFICAGFSEAACEQSPRDCYGPVTKCWCKWDANDTGDKCKCRAR